MVADLRGHLVMACRCGSSPVSSSHQELPRPLPVNTRLPAHLFGDALMVLEFLWAFGETFDLKNEFPDGVSLGENLQWLSTASFLPDTHTHSLSRSSQTGSEFTR